MARRSMPAVVALLVAAAVAAAAEASTRYDAKTFTVTGTVLCQDCTKNWNAYAYNAKPIPGSVVAVMCLGRGKLVHYGSDATDGKGAFNVEVPATVNGFEIDPLACHARLVSSGDAGCAVPTDFNGGLTGSALSRPSQLYPGKVTFTVGPYYYTLPQCDLKGDDGCSKSSD
ncbi:hypothetical protein ACP70R_019603 [Stipagrostis hirtigluma subsp. patula]